MSLVKKYPGMVGQYIKQKREAANLSQRALGLQFDPPVTTQFISNLERGVTPLPASHVPVLVKALNLATEELLALMEKEYTARISEKLGRNPVNDTPTDPLDADEQKFFNALKSAFKSADPKAKQVFLSVCESALGVKKQ